MLRSGVVVSLVTAVLVAAAGPGAAAGVNLLKNGDFEGTGTGSTAGWTMSNGTLSLAGDGIGGGYAGQMSDTAAGTLKMTASPKPVKSTSAGAQYAATGSVRSDTPGKSVCLQVVEQSSAGNVSTSRQCTTTTSGWTQFPEVDLTVQATGDSLSFYVLQNKAVVGDSYEVDNLSIVDVNADSTPPSAPTGLNATAPGPYEVDLAWTASPESDVASYAVYRDGGSTPVAQVNAPATTAKDTTVSSSTTYSYTVVAIDTSGNASAPSSPASVTTPVGTSTGAYDVWHLDETSGTTMADSVGNHPGILHNVLLGHPGDPAYPGTSYGFNGSGSYVTVPTADDLNDPQGADVHISFSLRTTTVPAKPDYDLFRKGQYPGQEYKIEMQPNGQVSCTFRGSVANYSLQAGPDLHDGAWHHIVCEKLATSVRLTIDGVVYTKAKTIGS
ncbi:MAG TPA: laminin G domain-containing protein, partial [Marmoricola sp.]|nr:laminin G domain-containing protein [Marmoricola sp.]